MPNTRAAAKRMRADVKRHFRKLGVKSRLKTLVRRFSSVLKAGKADEARQLFQSVSRLLDQAASKKVLHRNTASRKKSRLAQQLAKLR